MFNVIVILKILLFMFMMLTNIINQVELLMYLYLFMMISNILK